MYLALGRWQGTTDEVRGAVWMPPAATGFLGGIDIRAVAQQAVAPTAGAQGGAGIFVYDTDPAGATGIVGTIGDDPQTILTAAQRSALEHAFGMTARGQSFAVGVRLGTAIFQGCTFFADPTGAQGPRGLQPQRDLRRRLVLGPFDASIPFDITDAAERAPVLSAMKRDYAALRAWWLTRDSSLTIPRKLLGAWLRQFRVSDPTLFQDTTDEPLDPTTSLSDSFAYSNGALATVSSGAWADILAGVTVNTNEVSGGDAGGPYSRYETDLSSGNHNCQIDYSGSNNGAWGGPCCRFDPASTGSSDANFYQAAIRAGISTNFISRINNGTGTQLASSSTNYLSPFTTKLDVNGSTLTFYKDGVAILGPVTDASPLPGTYTRCGMSFRGGGLGDTSDNWQAADDATGTTITVPLDNLSQTDNAPVVSTGVKVTAPADSLSQSDNAPAVGTGAKVIVPQDSLTQTDNTPGVSTGVKVTAPQDSLVQTDNAPTVAVGSNTIITVPLDTLAQTDNTPTIAIGVNAKPPTDTLGFTDNAPSIGTGVKIASPVDNLVQTDNTPSIGTGVIIRVPLDTLSVASNAPRVAGGASVTVPADILSILDNAPRVAAGANVKVPLDSLSILFNTPRLTVNAGVIKIMKSLSAKKGSITISGKKLSITLDGSVD